MLHYCRCSVEYTYRYVKRTNFIQIEKSPSYYFVVGSSQNSISHGIYYKQAHEITEPTRKTVTKSRYISYLTSPTRFGVVSHL